MNRQDLDSDSQALKPSPPSTLPKSRVTPKSTEPTSATAPTVTTPRLVTHSTSGTSSTRDRHVLWEHGRVTLGVFLLDDHEVVRTGLRSMFEATDDLVVVGEASTSEEALTRIPLTLPQVAVLDVRLPDGSGVEVCREIRSRWPAIVCVMLTSYADDEALYAAILAGAAGYVLKQVGVGDLVDDIRRAGAGQSLLDPAVTVRVLERLQAGPREDPRLATLTAQERKVLELIAEGKTNRQIAADLFLAEKTVKNYVSNVLAKLGMERRTQAATYAARLDERSTRDIHDKATGT
jgi:two-component system response regulator DevR